MTSVSHSAPIHLGLDVHRDTISVGILAPGDDSPRSTTSPTTRHRSAGSSAALVIPRRLRACYEVQHLFAALAARPTGDTAHRLRWSLWRRRHQTRARTCHS